MQDDWPPVCILNVSPRVTHNDETPVPVTMNGDQKEVFAEDIHALHDKNTLSKVGQNFMVVKHSQSNVKAITVAKMPNCSPWSCS